MIKQIVQRGFTLIELLVVIAIIGILASVVLASLNTARDKGSTAAVKGSLSTIRTQAELFYDSTANTYGTAAAACTAAVGTLFADQTIAAAITSINANDGTAAPDCDSTATAWAIAVSLKGTPNTYMCADSTGYSSENNRAGAAYTGLVGAAATDGKAGAGTVCR